MPASAAAGGSSQQPQREHEGLVNQKYALLPAFLQAKGLIRQHVSSFNHFIGSDLLKIIKAKGNERVTCDADPNFYLRCGAGGSPDGGSAACSLPRRLAGRQSVWQAGRPAGWRLLTSLPAVLDVVPPCAALLGSPSAAPSAPSSHHIPCPLPSPPAPVPSPCFTPCLPVCPPAAGTPPSMWGAPPWMKSTCRPSSPPTSAACGTRPTPPPSQWTWSTAAARRW